METNKTINISMPKALLDAIDKQAEIEYRNRSDLIREAARSYIAQKGGMNTVDEPTDDEKKRMKAILNFSNFRFEPTIVLSCVCRPQPNSIDDIFDSTSPMIGLIERPPKMRVGGWDLDTLDRAKPVAGEFLEVKSGDNKILRVYRDGQHIFAGGMQFFGLRSEPKPTGHDVINLFSVAEFITNFAFFSAEVAKNVSRKEGTRVFTITVSNPRKQDSLNEQASLILQVPNNIWSDNEGQLNLDWVQRDIVDSRKDNLTPEVIAYRIYSEFCYFFGARSNELWYTNKKRGEMDKAVFLKQGR